MSDHPKPRPPHTGCPTCGHTIDHDGRPVTQIACDATEFERDRVIRELSTAAGIPGIAAARVLDTLISLEWRPGGER